MKKIDFGQSLSILANVGVLIGILLLVYELTQNRQSIQGQTRSALFDSLTSYLTITLDPEINDLLLRIESGDAVSEADMRRFRVVRNIQFRYFENMHYQYRNGLLDDEEYSAQREFWRQSFDSKSRVDHWCDVRDTYSPDFVTEIDALLTTYQCN